MTNWNRILKVEHQLDWSDVEAVKAFNALVIQEGGWSSGRAESTVHRLNALHARSVVQEILIDADKLLGDTKVSD